jgi:hypothetical protein
VCFTHTSSFADADPEVNNALQLIRDVILQVVPVAYPADPHTHCQMQSLMECFNISGGPEDGDDPRNVNILESEGSRVVVPPDAPSDPISHPLRIRKINIRTEDTPNFTDVEDYWDDELISKVTDLLHEFQDIFPTKFSDMKGILGDLGEMKIPLKLDAKPIRQ